MFTGTDVIDKLGDRIIGFNGTLPTFKDANLDEEPQCMSSCLTEESKKYFNPDELEEKMKCLDPNDT